MITGEEKRRYKYIFEGWTTTTTRETARKTYEL